MTVSYLQRRSDVMFDKVIEHEKEILNLNRAYRTNSPMGAIFLLYVYYTQKIQKYFVEIFEFFMYDT